MDSFLKADIFFFVSTVFTILIGIFLLVFLFYMMRIARNAKDISERVREAVKDISEDIDDKRKQIKRGGIGFQDIVAFFIKKPKAKPAKKARSKTSRGAKKKSAKKK
jgi:pyruvate/2-oxoglutarate dehydrogenase complex dihydrolipoamide acyltransferase (E2) component